MRRLTLPVLAALGLLAACGASSQRTLTSRATASNGALSVEVLTEAPLKVGLNRLYYRVTSGGQAVTSATLVQRPLMTMSTMSHACPQVAPATTAAEDGLFEGVVVFNMPSGEMDRWDLALDVTPQGAGAATTVTFGALAVADSTARRMVDAGTASYLLTFNYEGAGPRVGSNAVTVTAHRATNMKMTWLPVTDLGFRVTPEMPSMGHGSSGNVDPVHQGDGLYQGAVNLSMSGDWVVHLDVSAADGGSLGRLDFASDL